MNDENKKNGTIAPIEIAKQYFEIVEQNMEHYYDHSRINHAKESMDIFQMEGLNKEADKVLCLAGLQRTPSFLSELQLIDPWEWALDNFLDPFPFMDENAFTFYKERISNEMHPLAKARYYYAICCWDEKERPNLLKDSGELFVEVGLIAIEDQINKMDALAAAREINLGIGILQRASFKKELTEIIIKILEQIKKKSSTMDLSSLMPFIDAISNYLNYASKDIVVETADTILIASEKVNGELMKNVLGALLNWQVEYLSEIHKIAHTKICDYLVSFSENKDPLVAHHFLCIAATHARKAGQQENAGMLLSKAEIIMSAPQS
jgi:hypothetical protein